MKTFLIVLGIIIAIIVGCLLLRVVLFPVHVANTVMNTAENVITKTLDADRVIFNYEMFHDLYQGSKQQLTNIEQIDLQIKDLKKEYDNQSRNTWDRNGKERLSFLEDTKNGYLTDYNRIVSDYNSNSKKINRKLFKDRSLPYELNSI